MENQPAKLSERRKKTYSVDRPKSDYSVLPRMPKNLMLELSNACNHACIFCANPHMKRKIGRMDGGLARRVMQEARAEGVEEVGFYTTGDPFIHRDLTSFTRYASELGFSYIYISTNGALATPKRAKQVIDAGMNSIKFSINAGSRETYKIIHGRDEFDLVLEHLRFVSEYRKTLDRKLRLYVTFVVTKQTEHEVKDFEARVASLVDEVYFSPCGNQSGQTNKLNALLAIGQDPPTGDAICPLPFTRLHVSCEGYLTLCCVDYQNYLAVADLKEMSVGEAWRCDAFQAARRSHLERELAGTLCGNCWLGRTDAIKPLDQKLASPIDFLEFYDEGAAETERRLKL
jgi:pyruvate-formate lyase-activating enzyme